MSKTLHKNYFGHNCKYFIGQWETCDVQADTERTMIYRESEPVLNFCNHKGNPEDTEGNCSKSICPLKNW